MLDSDERMQIRKFDEALANLIDAYLKEGMSPDDIISCLMRHHTSDLRERRTELESQN